MAKITVSNAVPATKEGAVKAEMTLNISGMMEIHGCRIVEGPTGTFLSLPRRKNQESGKWSDIVSILDKGLKKELEDAGMEAYKALGQPQEESQTVPF